ncbi:MAG: UMP kinase, partial [Bacteroidales bacterium]|nr:UMP kinase [Bacteroidales bacterium]
MKYKRVLLKLSGESLGGPDGQGLDAGVLSAFAQEICPVVKDGVQVAVVIGGGNIFRGLKGVGEGYERVHGDQMGMLATVINSIALADALRDMNLQAEVYTATPMLAFANYYKRDAVLSHLEKGVVTLLAGGTGNPFFTTDSASALRAIELGADAVLKGTRVDG